MKKSCLNCLFYIGLEDDCAKRNRDKEITGMCTGYKIDPTYKDYVEEEE